MRDPFHVVVVGGGFSGVALVAQLLRCARGRLAVTLVETGAKLGRGIAYGTPDEQHLLNTRAANMSLLGDDPDHFIRWNQMRGQRVAPDTFAARCSCGEYLEKNTLALARCDEPRALGLGGAHPCAPTPLGGTCRTLERASDVLMMVGGGAGGGRTIAPLPNLVLQGVTNASRDCVRGGGRGRCCGSVGGAAEGGGR
jgi:hypothetical protein